VRNRGFVVVLVTLASAAALWEPSVRGDVPEAERYWARWRGPHMTGVAPHATPPLEWSETKNVGWKVEIPGKGSATPVVWGDTLFVLTAVPTGERVDLPEPDESVPEWQRNMLETASEVQAFTVLALRRSDGTTLWKRVVRKGLPHEGTHATGSWASASPVTDGEILIASFGSQGIYALDMDGEVLWENDLGDMTIKLAFGEGSSPALGKDAVFVQWDHEGDSFLAALDRKTGKELWRQPRDEGTSWASPLLVEHDGRTQVVTSATNKVRSYDAAGGEILWETPGMTQNAIPMPVYRDGLLFLTSGFRGNALLAVKLAEAKGDISGSSAIVWSHDRDTPYVPSPLLYGDELYLIKDRKGLLSCFDARTGEVHYGPERLPDMPSVYASPLGADDRIYVTSREGTTVVVHRGPEMKILATNVLEDGFDASPVAVDSELYLRGQKHLYRISE
jgi:outer membrane protein assembly factor BamB